MNVNFDSKIKKSLENLEQPYDENAWVELSKKLDISLPVSTKSTSKWWFFSGLLLILSLTSGYLLLNKTHINNTSLSKNNNQTDQFNNRNSEIQSIHSNKKSELNTTKIENNKNQNQPLINENQPIKNNVSLSKNDNIEPIQNSSTLNNNSNASTSQIQTLNHSIHLLDKKDFDKPKFQNHTTIPSNPITIDFEFDNELTYEKGLPVINLTANNNYNSYDWSSEKLVINQKSKEITIHPFKKGVYPVTLTVNHNGLTISETKKITIDDDYNLLAANAFSPFDNNEKTKTFIPYALTVRNVKFEFTILDAKDGGIMYQTNDPNLPWDGIDKRTGNLVEQNENCIWKVIIENPEPGENSFYKGVIIRL